MLENTARATLKTFQVEVCGERLTIPGRVYLDRQVLEAACPDCQSVLVDAVLTRHHDGFVRAEALARLMASAPDWAPAYVVPPIGEHVVEIAEQIDGALVGADASAYRAFVRANPAFMTLTRQRVVSYWACYWRARWPDRADYPGARALARLDAMAAD